MLVLQKLRDNLVIGIGVLRARAARAKAENDLRALTARLQTVREEEKVRIARDLHDDLGQLLTALKMDVRWVERKLGDLPGGEGVHAMLDRVVSASELLDRMVQTVQRVAAELRPSALSQLGLAAALAEEARRFTKRTGIACEVVMPEAQPTLQEGAATALYRIAQEALTNVARHAAAHRVTISLAVEGVDLVLRVEDDGTGFDVEAAGQSLGLLGMKERALVLGGEFRVARGAERGTVATATLPLARIVTVGGSSYGPSDH